MIILTFSQNPMLEKLDVLSGGSPFGTLYQFAIGILVFFIIKENKINVGLIFLAILSIGGMIFRKDLLIWCCICSILIIAFQDIEINCKQFEKYVVWLSRKSFHVYLGHILAFDCSWRIVTNLELHRGIKYVAWGFVSFVILMILCFLMDFLERIIDQIIKMKKY